MNQGCGWSRTRLPAPNDSPACAWHPVFHLAYRHTRKCGRAGLSPCRSSWDAGPVPGPGRHVSRMRMRLAAHCADAWSVAGMWALRERPRYPRRRKKLPGRHHPQCGRLRATSWSWRPRTTRWPPGRSAPSTGYLLQFPRMSGKRYGQGVDGVGLSDVGAPHNTGPPGWCMRRAPSCPFMTPPP